MGTGIFTRKGRGTTDNGFKEKPHMREHGEQEQSASHGENPRICSHLDFRLQGLRAENKTNIPLFK